ncbi:MAG TPA: DUF2283 domain-containing protein [Bacteroidia bacterium]
MKVIYDPKEDVVSIILKMAPIAESNEGKPGIIMDYDRDGNLIGLDILEASMRIGNPRSLEYAIRA